MYATRTQSVTEVEFWVVWPGPRLRIMSDIHPSAVVAPSARIGDGCVVGPYAVIEEGVRMGPDNIIGPHTVIEGETVIGAGNRFLQFASIGAGPQISGWNGDPGRLIIGDGNVVREFVTIHGSLTDMTVIGSGVMLMATAHVAHDCRVGDHVKLANGATLGGTVEVGDHAWISGLCAVHQGVRIGRHAFVAGGSIVTQDVPPFCLVQGDRARLVSLNSVGLKRAGLSATEMRRLRQAYRVLFRSTGALSDRIAELGDSGELVAELVTFLQVSGRGAISTSRRPARLAA